MSSFPISLKEFTVNEWGGVEEDRKCPLCGKHWLRKNLTINVQNQLLCTLIRILGINLKLYNHFGRYF